MIEIPKTNPVDQQSQAKISLESTVKLTSRN